MSNATSYKVAESLYLVRQEVAKGNQVAKPVEIPTNHILEIDCSGSMSWDLPKIREQVKKKLVKLLKEGDTLSIVWFSGRGQCGILLEGEPVATLADLNNVNSAVDRWLKPVGMTGFKEPLELLPGLVERLAKKYPKNVNSLMFLSDGCDNQWSRPDVLKAMEKAAGGLSATTVVEYGYYADKALLTAMAEKAGGSLIFAQDFDSYVPSIEAIVQRRPVGGKRIDVKVEGDVIRNVAWTQENGDLVTYGIEGGSVRVPETTRAVWYLSPTHVGKKNESALNVEEISGNLGGDYDGIVMGVDVEAYDAAYAALSLFSIRMAPEIVLPFLKATGDVFFIEKFGGLFGKQKYAEFTDEAKAATFDKAKRMVKGRNPKLVPADDAFTVLDMLRLLASDEDNKVLLDHEAFKYSRISRGRVDASTVLTADEQAEVERLTEELTKAKKDAKKVAELSAKIAAISNKPAPLKFEADPAPDGYSVSNLTYNEEHPNVSLLVRKTGTVDISGRLPAEITGVPAKFPTFIFRNYAVVKDGLVNVEVLPTKLSAATLAKLFELHKAGKFSDEVVKSDGNVVLLNFKSLPVINRTMVKATSAKTLFENEWALTRIQAEQKVYKSFAKEKFGTKKSAGFEETYGKAAADWLKEQGFTDYSGFSPKSVQAESTDVYVAKELSIAIKGFSSIPSLNDFKKQAAKGKLTPSAQLMKDAADAVEKFLASDEYKKGGDPAFEKWLKEKDKALDKTRRALIANKAQQIFGVIVGQVWFTEFASIEEGALSLTVDGAKLDCKVEMKEREIKI